eukprot:1120003-Prymnesium_polylepis.1
MHRRRPCTRRGASRARARCASSSRTRSLRRRRHQTNRTHAARSQLWRQPEVCALRSPAGARSTRLEARRATLAEAGAA